MKNENRLVSSFAPWTWGHLCFQCARDKMLPADPSEAKIQSPEFPANCFLSALKAEVQVSCLGQFSCTFLQATLQGARVLLLQPLPARPGRATERQRSPTLPSSLGVWFTPSWKL